MSRKTRRTPIKRKRVAGKDKQLTFFEHLEELRSRIVKSAIIIIAASCLFYGYVDRLIPFLIKPVGHVVFTSPAEAFVAQIMLAFFGGIFLSMPVVLYQVWQFVSAGLTETERKYIVIFIPLAYAFFTLGCAFAYFAVLPAMLKFFLSFSTPYVMPMITVSQYISFVGTVVLSFGFIFELPLAIVLLTKIGIATPQFLVEKRRHAIVLIFIVSAVLTPSPDWVSQLIMAIPLTVLYEISIIFSKLTYRLNARRANIRFNPPSVS